MAISNVLQQYEYLPYPTMPVEKITPTPEQLFNYCCATAWHLKCQAMPPGNLRILDVGCGTGFKTMLLAAANPGCHVTGLDFSSESLKVARERALVCGFPEITFHELAIDAGRPGNSGIAIGACCGAEGVCGIGRSSGRNALLDPSTCLSAQ